jgi:phosphoglycerate dehydrogenase-like enzyme
MSKLVCVVDRDFRNPAEDFDMGLSAILDDPDIDVRFYTTAAGSEPIPSGALKDVDTFISVLRLVNADSLKEAGRLKWIGRFGAGFDNVDLAACTAKGVFVSNAPQGVWVSVPEIIVGYMLALTNKLKIYDRHIREKGFAGADAYNTRCLYGRTAGILGFGGIGINLAALLNAFSMKVQVCDPFADEKKLAASGVKKVDLDTLLAGSDFVSLNVPLTGSTRGIIGAKELAKMKKTAFLINTARGFVCDDAALAEALRNRTIAGAAVDVFGGEPDVAANPLVRLQPAENLILTPHVAGGGSIDAMTITGQKLSECVIRIKNGQFPINIVNPQASKEPVPPECLTPSFVAK